MGLSFSCAVAGLPCLKTVCNRIGGKLALSLADRTKNERQKFGKDDQWRGDEAMTPLKKLCSSSASWFCRILSVTLFPLPKNSIVDLRIVARASILAQSILTAYFGIDPWLTPLNHCLNLPSISTWQVREQSTEAQCGYHSSKTSKYRTQNQCCSPFVKHTPHLTQFCVFTLITFDQDTSVFCEIKFILYQDKFYTTYIES